MSMDDQYQQMQIFARTLSDFNEHLGASVNDLQRNHDNVSPLWRDQMRREYDAVWGPFEEKMKHYLEREAPNYEDFLDIKLKALKRYLEG
jgi:uncharacterized protein YukE